MDKRQLLEQIINEIKNLDISDIINKYIDLPKRVSGSYLGLCPFHSDTRLGSFVVTPQKGIFKCFACGAGGDAAKFVSLYKKINYVEAVFEIALQEGIINTFEYEEYFSKRRYSKKEIENIEKIYIEKNKGKIESNIADGNILNKVFNVFLDTLKLKAEHKEYLIKERKLSEELIERRKYRSCQYPTDAFLEKFKDNLKKENLPTDILERIPGFFQKKIKGKWEWTFAYNKGIFIPIKNEENQIIGLQIRKDKKDELRGRYFWFSSSFAFYKDSFNYGVSSGSPMDILYPDKKPNPVLIITEGRFKSEAIIKKINSVCISMQGVGNWRNVDRKVKLVENKVKNKYSNFKGFSHIYIAFDSDMKYKYQVYNQLRKMSNFLKYRIKLRKEDKGWRPSGIYYVYWKDSYKGIDDLLNNSDKNFSELTAVYPKEYWDSEYKRQLNKLMEEKGKEDPKDLSQEDLKKGICII